jgi:hypothetical protein
MPKYSISSNLLILGTNSENLQKYGYLMKRSSNIFKKWQVIRFF